MKRSLPAVAILWIAALTVVAVEPPPASPAVDDALATVHAFVAALNHADLDGVLDTLDASATAFLPTGAVSSRVSGKEALRNVFQPFLDGVRQTGSGPPFMALTPHDIVVQHLGDDAAVVTFHLAPLPSQPITHLLTLSRRTFVLRRIDAGWRIVHLHASNRVMEPAGSKEQDTPAAR